MNNGQEYSSSFSQDGKWIETQREIKHTEIPQTVIASLNKKYGKYIINESELVENKMGKSHELLISHDGADLEVMIDSKGTIVEEGMEEEEIEYDLDEDME